MEPSALLRVLRQRLRATGDPSRGTAVQAYMKSGMPFHGVPMPALRRTCRELFARADLSSPSKWRAATLFLWRHARYREERYAAITLARWPSAGPYQRPRTLPVYEEMIVSGAWWDLVDEIAVHCIGPLVRHFPGAMKPVMRRWSRDPDLWKRRTSILCQVGAKQATDERLLFGCIEPSLDSPEFFLRKAIGWALRTHAYLRPRSVERFVRTHRGRLSGLSRREALKHIGDRSAVGPRSRNDPVRRNRST